MDSSDLFGPVILAVGVSTIAYGIHWAGTQDSARNTARRTHAAIAELGLSERKTSTLSLDAQREVFTRDIVPMYGLVRGTKEYRTLERACIAGTFGSAPEDFDGPYENLYDFKAFEQRLLRARTTLDACGWKIKQ